ncbi:MAG: YdcF family protein [Vicinamibacteraceae bacterium]|nr:YdcF family protein [Vicinamibacteraceae bacterium]
MKPSIWRRVRTASIVTGVVLMLAAPSCGPFLALEVPIDRPDAIVMLASHEWERLPAAAEAARRWPGAEVWLTVPPAVTIYNCHRCGERVGWLESLGVRRGRIRELPLAATRRGGTWSEAEAARAAVRTTGGQRLLVVTSEYHTRRAWWTFRRVFRGLPVELGVAGARAHSAMRADAWWWTRPEDLAYVPYEWAALWKFLAVSLASEP